MLENKGGNDENRPIYAVTSVGFITGNGAAELYKASFGYTLIDVYQERQMHVSKWGNSLAVRLPSAVVDALGLKEGDQIEIRIVDKRVFEVRRDESRQRALARLRKLQRPLPAGFVFDREEANAR